ncbi:hypothetical protein QQ020_12730 [Fulvivirgaceae bacterium BMA12]|uniref:Uncharacterized protein n=1 Tax=Agaribacillus aureus TaxID=3051825 RepID=A0ABT8L5C9_9BACT|nr:hypothetical protein [Fulvivirgaceae bacterium BMA12]
MKATIFLKSFILLTTMPWNWSSESFQAKAQHADGWNISYTVPKDWTLYRTEGRLKMYMHQGMGSALFIAPALNQTLQGITNDIVNLAGVLNMQVQPTEPLNEQTINGKKVIVGAADFINKATHERQKSYGITVFGQNRTSLGMLVLSRPENIDISRKMLEDVVPTVRLGDPVENQQAVAALAGTWIYYSGANSPSIARSGSWSHSYEETVYFDGAGHYNWRSSSHVAATSDQRGNYQSSASNIGGNNSKGTYTVIENTLIVNNEQSSFAYDFQLFGGKLISGGRTFLRE